MAGLLNLLAHDLRNPLAALQSNVSYIGGAVAADDPEVREAIDDVTVSCEALGHLVDNLELLAHGITNAAPRGLELVSLSALVAETVAAHRAAAASHAVAIEITAQPEAAAIQILANRDLLRRSLGNLLRNAIQYGTKGTVTVELALAGDDASVVVADAGPPLDPTLKDAPFLAEGQLTVKSNLGGRYGRGLGLYSARVAATMAGATVGPVPPPAGQRHAMALTAHRA